MTRSKFAIAAVALLGIIAIASYATAHVLSGDAEVRISARRLDDGRTEFALQQRTDGDWAERILPSSRYFPANPSSDRWLNSSPLTVETEARESSGEDSTATSEELEEARAEAAAAKEALAEANAALARYTAPILRDIGTNRYDEGRIVTSVSTTELNKSGIEELATTIRVYEDGDHQFGDQPLELVISCRLGSLRHWLGPLTIPSAKDEWGSEVLDITYSLAGDVGTHESIRTGTERKYTYDAEVFPEFGGRQGIIVDVPSYLPPAIRLAESLEVTISGDAEGGSVTATFSLDGVWDTPVQPNIDRCGEYY